MSKKALLVLSLAGLMMVPSFAQTGTASTVPGPFRDMPNATHWAYPYIVELARIDVLQGYPGDWFIGDRPMTRYEYATATGRLYQWIVANTPPSMTDDAFRQRLLSALNNAEVQAAIDRAMLARGFSKGGGGTGLTQAQWTDMLRAALNDPAVVTLLQTRLGILDRAAIQGMIDTAIRGIAAPAAGLTAAQVNQLIDAALADANRTRALRDAAITALQTQLTALRNDVNANRDAIAALRNDVTAMGGRMDALQSALDAVTGRVTALENRLRFDWFGGVDAEMGVDGALNGANFGDGDIDLDPGEAYNVLSARVGADVAVNADTRGRVALWYDSDSNQHHGQNAGSNLLGLDEAWISTRALGGEWLFGRIYPNTDVNTPGGDAGRYLDERKFGLGLGYYTGAALTGARARYRIGDWLTATLLAHADDSSGIGVNAIGASNIAGVARLDADLPWFGRNGEGEPRVSLGVQSVAHWGNGTGNWPGAGLVKGFNTGQDSREWLLGADVNIRVLNGLRIEYINQLQAANGLDLDLGDAGTEDEGEAVYATLGVFDNRTLRLDLGAGFAESELTTSHSILTNPYVRTASPVFALIDRPILLGPPTVLNAGGIPVLPSTVIEGKLRWNVGTRPIGIRAATTLTPDRDAFAWMVYGSVPVVMGDNGSVSVGLGYIAFDAPGLDDALAGRVTASYGF